MKIKPIPNFPDYLISDTGIVYSIAPRANRGRPAKPIIKSQWMRSGYKAVSFQLNGKECKRYVHNLLLETFVRPRPKGYQCRHLDSNPLNNNLSNLAWGTRSENQMDRLPIGRDNRGSKHGMSKLTEDQAKEIKKLGISANKKVRKIDNGGDYKRIAKKFHVSKSTVESIILGRTWGWLK
ncbi:MAG: HNH endonuclease [Smithella sp.]